MRPESGTQPESFCAGIAQKDGAGGATVRSMNGSLFTRRTLPERPKSEGAQYAPSSPVARLGMEPMKAHFMRWTLPQKPRPHCEPQSQSLSRPWVKKRPMKTRVTPWNVSRKADSSDVLGTLLEAAGRGKKSAGMGMTPTPLANASPGRKRGVPGKETIAIPARATQRGGAQSRKRL